MTKGHITHSHMHKENCILILKSVCLKLNILVVFEGILDLIRNFAI